MDASASEPEIVRRNAKSAGFDENGQLVTLELDGADLVVVRGQPVPGAAVESLFTMPYDLFMPQVSMRQNAFFRITGATLVRHEGRGGAESTATPLASALSFVIDGDQILYSNAFSGAFRMALDGSGKGNIGATGVSYDAVAADATDYYFARMSTQELSHAAKSNGTVQPITARNMPTGMRIARLDASSTRLVGMSFAGSSLLCDGWKWTLWSVPKRGGDVTVLASGNGISGRTWVAGDDVYAEERGCSALGNATTRIFRQNVDGSGSRTLMADLGDPDEEVRSLEVSGAWLYWLGKSGVVLRKPR